jgi:hypothetical protein
MTERGKSPRQKSLYRGVVSFVDNNLTLDCTVRDISETGARLRFGSTPPIISEYLDLNIPIKGRTYRAMRVWCNVNEMGIAFETNFNVDVVPSHSSDAETLSQSSNDELTYRVMRLEAEITVLKQMMKRLQNTSTDKTEAA